MRARDVEQLIIRDFSQRITYDVIVLTIDELYGKAEEALNRSLDLYHKYLLKIAIYGLGLQQFNTGKHLGKVIVWDAFQRSELEYDTFYNQLLEAWNQHVN